jgi:nardilysin
MYLSQYLQLYIDGLCHDNLLEEEAISISNLFKMNFLVQPLPIELMSRDHCIWLPDDANLIRDAGVNNKSEQTH